MKNSLAAINRKIIPYNPEFRKLSLVKSVNAAILLQQLDFYFWFGKYIEFYKFLEPAPNHYSYTEGDSWTEELGFSAEEFTTAFRQIGIQYKSCKAYHEAQSKFVSPEGVEYYYASYIDRRRGITKYVRNDKLLDTELQKLVNGKEIVRKSKPEYHEEVRERIERVEAEQAAEATNTDSVVPKKAKKTPKEIAADKAAKEEQKRLRAEAKAKAELERQAQIDADNQWRYDLFQGKERYMRFNAWFWGTYVKGSTLENPGMFYSIMLKDLRLGGEKYRGVIGMFDVAEQKQAEENKIAAIQPTESKTNDEDEYFTSKLNEEELVALQEANLGPELYGFCLRQMEHQSHSLRMKTIVSLSRKQELQNYRKRLQESFEADS